MVLLKLTINRTERDHPTFSKKIIYVGVDVDDTAFDGEGMIRETGKPFEVTPRGT